MPPSLRLRPAVPLSLVTLVLAPWWAALALAGDQDENDTSDERDTLREEVRDRTVIDALLGSSPEGEPGSMMRTLDDGEGVDEVFSGVNPQYRVEQSGHASGGGGLIDWETLRSSAAESTPDVSRCVARAGDAGETVEEGGFGIMATFNDHGTVQSVAVVGLPGMIDGEPIRSTVHGAAFHACIERVAMTWPFSESVPGGPESAPQSLFGPISAQPVNEHFLTLYFTVEAASAQSQAGEDEESDREETEQSEERRAAREALRDVFTADIPGGVSSLADGPLMEALCDDDRMATDGALAGSQRSAEDLPDLCAPSTPVEASPTERSSTAISVAIGTVEVHHVDEAIAHRRLRQGHRQIVWCVETAASDLPPEGEGTLRATLSLQDNGRVREIDVEAEGDLRRSSTGLAACVQNPLRRMRFSDSPADVDASLTVTWAVSWQP